MSSTVKLFGFFRAMLVQKHLNLCFHKGLLEGIWPSFQRWSQINHFKYNFYFWSCPYECLESFQIYVIYIYTYIKNSHWIFCSHLQSTPNQPSKNAQLKYSKNQKPWRRRFSEFVYPCLIWWVKNSTSQRWELMLLWLVNLPPRWRRKKATRNSRLWKDRWFPLRPAN